MNNLSLKDALDIDDDNIRTSQEAVSGNRLESRIRIVKTDSNGDLIPLEKLEVEGYVNMRILYVFLLLM